MDSKLKKEWELFDRTDRELKHYSEIEALLHFDRATAIPKKGVPERAEQMSIISQRIHSIMTSKGFKSAVKKLYSSLRKDIDKFTFIEKRRIEKYYKELKKAEKLPAEFIAEYSRLVGLGEHYWEQAKEKNDYAIFKPYLKRIYEMKRKQAKLIDSKKHPYDVLLDDYEEGMTVKKLKNIFEELKAGLIETLNEIKKSKKYKMDNKLLEKIKYDEKAQWNLAEDVAKRILEDKGRWALAVSIHPFTTTIGCDDVRLTTAFRKNPMFCFRSTMHEAGHALYELDFGKNIESTILQDAPSLGIHESQSRFWENMIGKNSNFWKYYYSKFKKAYPQLEKISASEFYSAENNVKPGFIRIEADELTYCLHIIIRFEIEVALLEGKLSVDKLPKAWDDKYEQYLGIKPKDYSHGVLQDTHWSGGSIGYFPTYALGTIYAAQIFNAMKKKIKDMDMVMASSDYTPIRDWLKKNIHEKGSLYTTEEIIKQATGTGLDVKQYLDYLKGKYYPLYGVKEE